MAIETFNRVEEKYIINASQYNKIRSVIDMYMISDSYNVDDKCYVISNIYYDTIDNNLIRTSLEKPKYKEKIRLRGYGVPSENSKVFLELKKKYYGVVNKRRTVLALKEAYRFVDKNIYPTVKEYMNTQVLNELDYAIKQYNIVPKVYIAYDRRAFFGASDKNFRITFDTNIRTRRDNLRLEYGDYGNRLLPEGTMVMEVKYSERMPLWLLAVLNENGINKTSFSKYGTEYLKYLENNLNGNMEEKKYA